MEQAKILVVDHDERAYEPLKPGLAKHGYDMHTTTRAPHALSLAGVHGYQAALVSVPFIRDNSLVAGLHAELPNLPVIAVFSPDAYAIPTQVIEIADNSLGKPLALEPLRLMLDRTLELAVLRSRLKQQRQRGCATLVQRLVAEATDSVPMEAVTSFDEMLVANLRAIVPNMEVLGRGSLHRAVLSYVEKLLLSVVLVECRGNQVKASDILGINRNTLRKKLRDFGLTISRRSG